MNLVSLAMVLYRSYMEAAYHYVLLIVYLLINCHTLYTACRIVVGSASYEEDPLFPIQEAMQYRDCAEAEFVNIKTLAMSEDTIKTGTYDEAWTGGTIRIPCRNAETGYLEIPVCYEKGGIWKINTSAVSKNSYQEYIYFLFNR